MKVSSMFPSPYLNAEDVVGKTIQVQIAGVQMVELDDRKTGGRVNKPALYLSYMNKPCAKPLLLNRTNVATIAMDLGDETDMWPGHTIELFTIMTTDQSGKPVPGIRLRVIHTQHGTAPTPTVGHALPATVFAPIPAHVPLAPGGNLPPSSAYRVPAPAAGGYGAKPDDLDETIPF